MPIGNITCPNKISHYTSYLLPDDISVASKISISNLTILCESPKVTLLTSDYPVTDHIMIRYEHDGENVKILYCAR